MKTIRPLWILLGVLVLLALWGIGSYNHFITLDATVESQWAQVETQYQRRADLIPQLVATVQGAADFEQGTLVEVTEARTNWLNTQSDPDATREDQIAAANTFDSSFSRLLVSVESYPALTATQGFITLQSQLEGTENRISVARSDYNDSVKDFNAATARFPAVMFARIFGFESKEFFQAAPGTELAPIVDFDFSTQQ